MTVYAPGDLDTLPLLSLLSVHNSSLFLIPQAIIKAKRSLTLDIELFIIGH